MKEGAGVAAKRGDECGCWYCQEKEDRFAAGVLMGLRLSIGVVRRAHASAGRMLSAKLLGEVERDLTELHDDEARYHRDMPKVVDFPGMPAYEPEESA